MILIRSTLSSENDGSCHPYKFLALKLIQFFVNNVQIQIVCIATIFEGKTSVQRQRLVYKAIWDEMSGPVHAVDSIIAKTPTEMGN